MNKQQATAQISKLLIENGINLEKAQALADEFDIEFRFEAPEGTSISYVPQNGKRPTVQDYYDGEYDEEAQEESGDYNFAGWQNSSTFC